MKRILVTGANGQLGKCLKDVSQETTDFLWEFKTKQELDITNQEELEQYLDNNSFDFCVNTAAYTNVEQAEQKQDLAFKVNAEAVKFLSEACDSNDICLIHVSTDYVFDGTQTRAYKEQDRVNPINLYGASKLRGEEYIIDNCSKYFVVRSSWLYSQYGHNFFKSVLRWAAEGRDLEITTSQRGCPTNANDLSQAIFSIIQSESNNYGVYHFSNKGETTWYDFAYAILKHNKQLDRVNLAKTDHYRTFAKRPDYSVLDTQKFTSTFGFQPEEWEDSLKKIIHKINKSHGTTKQ